MLINDLCVKSDEIWDLTWRVFNSDSADSENIRRFSCICFSCWPYHGIRNRTDLRFLKGFFSGAAMKSVCLVCFPLAALSVTSSCVGALVAMPPSSCDFCLLSAILLLCLEDPPILLCSNPSKRRMLFPFFCTSRPFISILSSYFFMLLLLLPWTLHLALVPSACLLVASCLWMEQAPRVIGLRRGSGIRADVTFFSIGSSQSISQQPEMHFGV